MSIGKSSVSVEQVKATCKALEIAPGDKGKKTSGPTLKKGKGK